MNYSKEQFCKLFDNTLLKPFSTTEDFRKICNQSAQYGFCSVEVNKGDVRLCS